MKNTTKLKFAIFVFTLLFTACSSSDDDAPQPEQVAKEITAHELLNYMIVEERVPKPEQVVNYGNNPFLFGTYLEWDPDNDTYRVITRNYWYSGQYAENPIIAYDAQTGISRLKTGFGYIDLTRNNDDEIIVKNISNSFFELEMNQTHVQAIKQRGTVASNYSYKAISGPGYYKFNYSDNKWRYKADAMPTNAELTWDFTKFNGDYWAGQDGGTAQLRNIFLFVPKGNGWKGQYKDKDLLLINTIEKDNYKAVGDIGVYEIN